VPFPRDCEGCSEEEMKRWGCGYEKIAGRHKFEYTGAKEPYSRTCPQFFLRQPAVDDIIAGLRDYKRAALGNVRKLGSAYLTYLRIAESETSCWEAKQDAMMYEAAKNAPKIDSNSKRR
jgi:hypothetical protein